MLSPFCLFPTVFKPSFQSPEPILGNPCSPKFRLLSIALMQCVYTFSFCFDSKYTSYLSSTPSGKSSPIT